MGPAVGIVTTSDLLHAIVLGCDAPFDGDGGATPLSSSVSSDAISMNTGAGGAHLLAGTALLRSSNSSGSDNIGIPGAAYRLATSIPPGLSSCVQHRVPRSPAACAAAAKGQRNSLPCIFLNFYFIHFEYLLLSFLCFATWVSLLGYRCFITFVSYHE